MRLSSPFKVMVNVKSKLRLVVIVEGEILTLDTKFVTVVEDEVAASIPVHVAYRLKVPADRILKPEKSSVPPVVVPLVVVDRVPEGERVKEITWEFRLAVMRLVRLLS